MNIKLKGIGKKFAGNWIFRHVDFECKTKDSVGILGTNGSGKSTLLQIISGYTIPSSGSILYTNKSTKIPVENIYKYITFASPYIELEDDLTLKENIWFFKQFKHLEIKTEEEFCDRSLFAKAELNKCVRDFSSGMKQRLKLAFVLFSNSEMKLFDEPLSNLDARGMEWFESTFNERCGDKLVFLNSNHHERELALTTKRLNIEDYKKDKR